MLISVDENGSGQTRCPVYSLPAHRCTPDPRLLSSSSQLQFLIVARIFVVSTVADLSVTALTNIDILHILSGFSPPLITKVKTQPRARPDSTIVGSSRATSTATQETWHAARNRPPLKMLSCREKIAARARTLSSHRWSWNCLRYVYPPLSS